MNTVPPSRLYVRIIAGSIAALSALLLASYILLVITGGNEFELGPALITVALVLIYILSSIFGIAIFREKINETRLRRSWLLIAIAVLFPAFVEILWVVYARFNIQPSLELTEILTLCYYPFMLTAVLSYPFAPGTRRERLIFWMDIVIVATTLGMFLWVFILNAMQSLILIYPAGTFGVVFSVANLLLVVGFIGLIQRDVTASARVSLIFLGLGALCATLADGWLVYCQISGQPCTLTIVNILRLGAAEGILLAATMVIVLRTGTKVTTPELYKPFSPVLRLVIPYLAVAAGLALLINMVYLVGFADQSLMGALFGSIVLVGLVLVRQFIVLQENARLYREMQRLAVTDSLTGLFNRHYFNETLGREIERSNRYDSSLTLLLMDVDRFKMFNDRYGHLQGDEVLKMTARVLAGQLRRTDILARFGGDEFAIILPETDRGGAINVSKKIEQIVAQQKYKDWRLGVCVGVGIYHQGMTPENLIEQADRNLYRHKATKNSAYIIRKAERLTKITKPETGETTASE